MPEKVTKEEALVRQTVEQLRLVKQLIQQENEVNLPYDDDMEEVKVKRPKAENDNTKIENNKDTHSGYGLAGEISKASREFEIINKYIMFLNNTSGDEFIEAVFGEPYSKMENHRKDYVQKFMKERNSTRLWGMLDDDKRQALIDAAMKKYS